jgi:hypothetical protein
MTSIQLTDIKKFSDRTTPRKFTFLQSVDYAYLASMLQSSTILNYLSTLDSYTAPGANHIFFRSFGVIADKYSTSVYRYILAFSVQHKNSTLFSIIARYLFLGTFEIRYGTALVSSYVATTDTSPISYTDEGSYTDASSDRRATLLFKLPYILDEETNITGNSRESVLSAVSINKEFLVLVLPARLMAFFSYLPNLFYSRSSHIGLTVSSTPFTSSAQLAILDAKSNADFDGIYTSCIPVGVSSYSCSVTRTDRVKCYTVECINEPDSFAIASEEDDLNAVNFSLDTSGYTYISQISGSRYFYVFYINFGS